jgi:cytochrome c oxidase subunit II
MHRKLTVFVVTVAALSLVGLLSQHSLRAETTPAKTITINAKRFSFEPGTVTLKQGVPVTLELHSDDTAHGLRVNELGINLKAAKGATTRQVITPGKAGDFVGHCSTFCGSGHGAMSITFHVVP